MGAKKVTFARDATGLVREIGWFTALSIVLCNVIGGGINKYSVNTPAAFPLANVPLAFAIGAIPAISAAVVFALFGVAMPRSGGGYVYISRTMSPFLGFLSSWVWWVSVALSFGIIAFLDTAFLGFGLQVIGRVPTDGLFQIGTWMQSTEAGIIVGIILVVVFYFVTVAGLNIFGKVLNAMLIIAAIGSVLTIFYLMTGNTANAMVNYALAYSNPIDFFTSGGLDNAFTRLFNNYFVASLEHYWNGILATTPMDDTVGAVALLTWAYIGFTASTFVGGEMKEPNRSMIISVIYGTLIIAAYYVGISFLALNTSGLFANVYVVAAGAQADATWALTMNPQYAWIAAAIDPNLWQFIPAYLLPSYPAPIGTQLPFYATLQVPYASGPIAFFIAIAGAIWLMNDIPPFLITAARTTFAWSFDRTFPVKFAEVSERWHSPVWATTLVGIVAIGGVLLSSVDIFMAAFDTVVMDTTMLWIGAMAAILFPYIKPEIYERGLKWQLGGIPVITIVGVIAFFGTTFVIFAAIRALALQGFLLNVFVFGLGGLIFAVYYAYNRKIGVDMATIYAEIPPE
ncbi:MAG: APC family permease [Candidatus Jordarchaeum sp.]|uniref:APC family permease n=1 Tax=Candidatus Jordarchaeum sp. TaxID=2823881 RepID=UPI00404A2F23